MTQQESIHRDKHCVICNQRILEDIERWVRITDFNCGLKEGEAYNHLECWKDRFKYTNSERQKEMVKKTIGVVKGIKDAINQKMVDAQ